MTRENTICLRLLKGSNGDLVLGFDGGFRYVTYHGNDMTQGGERSHNFLTSSGYEKEHDVLVQIHYIPEYRMELTKAGAQFLMENLDGGWSNATQETFIRNRAGWLRD